MRERWGERLPNRKILYGAASAVVLVCLIMTYTRGAWLGVMAGMCIYLMPKVGRLKTRVTRRGAIVAGLAVCLSIPVALAVVRDVGLGHLPERISARVSARMEALWDLSKTEPFRLAQYRTTLNVLREHPFLGVGFGNFTRLFDRYKDASTPSPVSYIARTTENMYLMLACETGILGLIAALALFVAIVWVVYRGYRSAAPGPDRDLLLALLAAFCGFLVNMITWDALNQPTIRMTFWMLVGMAFSVRTLKR